jgi:hypothetical protein
MQQADESKAAVWLLEHAPLTAAEDTVYWAFTVKKCG